MLRSRGWTCTGEADVRVKRPPHPRLAASPFPHSELAPEEGKSREARKGDGKLSACNRARKEIARERCNQCVHYKITALLTSTADALCALMAMDFT